jgi:capsule biosynthesis phosphatase
MNILIPILGQGLRFAEENYIFPKAMIRSCGDHLLSKIIKSIKFNKLVNSIYILYREEFDSFNFKETILHNTGYLENLKFIPYNKNTRGAAESILIGSELIDNNEKILVLDCDTTYNTDIVETVKKFNNGIVYTKNYDSKAVYSYIIFDDNNKLLSIEEKNKISNNICTGAYLFKNKSYIKKYASLAIESYKAKECYISSIYQEMIKNKENIDAIYIKNFNCYGTPEQLKKLSSNIHCCSNFEQKRFCFDLDNTLVSYPRIPGDYKTVSPLDRNINFLNYLYGIGHYIIIYSARRMKTHNGDVEKVKLDIEEITIETLKKFNIPYHELIFGKPYADFYIDDLAINAFGDIEKETGFYMLHTEPRSYNSLKINKFTVEKFSKNIDGETYYYQNIPNEIKHLYPKVISYKESSILIEKINGIPLSYLYVSKEFNEDLLYSLLKNIKLLHKILPEKNFSYDIYINYTTKLKERINLLNLNKYENFYNIYNSVVDVLNDYEAKKLGICGIIHGDPVFSNILIDCENKMKFIDMRGKLGCNLNIYGDIMYDYAKIYQSIIGYDFVLYNKIIDKEKLEKYKKIFKKYIVLNYGELYINYIKNITNSFIISLLPLHSESNRKKFYELINNS